MKKLRKTTNFYVVLVATGTVLFQLTVFTAAVKAVFLQNTQEQNHTVKRWQKYLSEKEQLAFHEKISQLEHIIRLDSDFAEAYAELARTYAEKNELDHRVMAVKLIAKAIALEPTNPSFRFIEGEINLRRDQYAHRTRSAKTAFEKAIALKPDYGDAYFQLGLLAEQQFLNDRHVVAQHKDWAIRFEAFALEKAEQAKTHFNNAIAFLSDPAPAYFRLALLYFELREFNKMQLLLQRAIANDSTNSDYWLFSGLAYYSLALPEKASACFNKARQTLPDSMRSVFDAVEMIITPEQAALLQANDDLHKQRFAERHWRQSDPLYLTAVNERQLEHYARVAYANLRFGIARKNIAGYRTDAGKTFIRFGIPNTTMASRAKIQTGQPSISAGVDLQQSAFSQRGQRRVTNNAKSTAEIRSGRETWNYGAFAIPFDRKMSGHYEFAWGVENDDGREIYNRIIRKTPELFEPVLPGAPMPLHVTMAAFEGENGQSDVLVFAGFPTAESSEGAAISDYRARQGFFVFDTLFNPITRQMRESDSGQLQLRRTADMICSQELVALPPGVYEYSLELIDLSTRRVGIARSKVTAKNFTTRTLRMSDILIAHSIVPASEAEKAFVYKGFAIEPAPNLIFEQNSRIDILYEIYRLRRIDGASKYRVDISLYSKSKPKSDKDSRDYVTVSYVYSGEKSEALHSEALDLSAGPAGEWQLVIRVEDLLSEASVQESCFFTISSN